jgi:hypothetical protein
MNHFSSKLYMYIFHRPVHLVIYEISTAEKDISYTKNMQQDDKLYIV